MLNCVFLQVNWCPFYWLVKCALLIWLMAPVKNNGAIIIYNQVLLPIFYKLKNKADLAKKIDKDSKDE